MESSYVFKYYGGPGPNEGTRIVMALGGLKWRPTAWNNGAPPGPGDAMKAEGSWGGPTATVTPGPGEWAESRWNIRTSAKREAEDGEVKRNRCKRCGEIKLGHICDYVATALQKCQPVDSGHGKGSVSLIPVRSSFSFGSAIGDLKTENLIS